MVNSEKVKAGILLENITEETKVKFFINGRFEAEYPRKDVPDHLHSCECNSFIFDFSYNGNIPTEAFLRIDIIK